MSKPKLTDWFPSNVKPVHVGVYEMNNEKDGIRACWQKWNGEWWCRYCNHPYDAAQEEEKSIFQDRRWRGLAEEP